MKRTLLLYAALLAVVLCAGACGETASSDETASKTALSPENSSAAETESAEPSPYDPGLPKTDFEGKTFTFAVRGHEGDAFTSWSNVDIVVPGLNGEVLNDAFFMRTRAVEEAFNTKINVLYCGSTGAAITGSEMSKMITESVMSGDDVFDAILSSPYDTVGYAMNGYTIDLNTLPYLDLSKPWWDQNANAELSFGNKIYFTTGELTIIDNIATQCLLFNKTVAVDHHIDDSYEAVRNGTWTIDKMFENTRAVAGDLNGDGVIDENDRYGYIYWQDACFGWIHACGNSFGEIGQDGLPTLTFGTERMFDTWSKIMAIAKDKSTLALYNELKVYQGEGSGAMTPMMSGGNTLYSFGYVVHAMAMRNVEADFGILPLPKYDEAQERYYATAHGYGTAFLSVPITNSDPERTGMTLEAFCAKSAELVTPAFYDVYLTTKSVRDEESAEMLDIIYANKKYDIGYFFMWGDLTNAVMNAWNLKNENLVSLYEKRTRRINNDLESTITLFTENNAD